MEIKTQQLEENLVHYTERNQQKNPINKYVKRIIFISLYIMFIIFYHYLFGNSISKISYSLQEFLDKTKNCNVLRYLDKLGSSFQ